MKVYLNDQEPVQQSYNPIPIPLFKELKYYTEDLLKVACRVRVAHLKE